MSASVRSYESVRVEGAAGEAPVLLLCEHASRHIPDEFGDLGLSDETRRSHVAWDPGAAEIAHDLAGRLQAPLVAGGVSRLLYDCNRPPDSADAIPARSEIFDIPGNRDLSEAARESRIISIYEPFVAAVERTIGSARPKAIVTVHSFTPVYFGEPRSVELGVLHDTDSRLADAMLAESGMMRMSVERNQPYGPDDGVTHSLRKYAVPRGLLNVMLEIRSDLISDPASQRAVAGQIERLLIEGLARCGVRLAVMQ